MLVESKSVNWNAKILKTAFHEMVKYFDRAEPQVITDYEGIGDVQLGHGVMFYVSIEREAGGKDITVITDQKGQIIEVESGRH